MRKRILRKAAVMALAGFLAAGTFGTVSALAGQKVKITSENTSYTVWSGKDKETRLYKAHFYDEESARPYVYNLTVNGKSYGKKNYTVKYIGADNIGPATLKITGKNKLNGTITQKYVILPGQADLRLHQTKKKGKVQLYWWIDYTSTSKKGVASYGYELQYKLKGQSWNKAKAKNISSAKYNSSASDDHTRVMTKTVKIFKRGKTYNVRIRPYKVVNGIKYYGDYCKTQTLKVK